MMWAAGSLFLAAIIWYVTIEWIRGTRSHRARSTVVLSLMASFGALLLAIAAFTLAVIAAKQSAAHRNSGIYQQGGRESPLIGVHR
jgi:hypothetical protein